MKIHNVLGRSEDACFGRQAKYVRLTFSPGATLAQAVEIAFCQLLATPEHFMVVFSFNDFNILLDRGMSIQQIKARYMDISEVNHFPRDDK